MKRVYILIIILFNLFLNAQTGPAGVGTIANNPLWLKADAGTSTTTNNAPISSWNDQSGNGINVSQATASLQPTYLTNALNGMPAIQFDNATGGGNDKLIAPDNSKLDGTPGLSIFTVSNLNKTVSGAADARTIVSKRNNVGVEESYMLFYYTGSKFFVDIEHSTNDRFSSTSNFSTNTDNIIDVIYDGSLTAANRSKIHFWRKFR